MHQIVRSAELKASNPPTPMNIAVVLHLATTGRRVFDTIWGFAIPLKKGQGMTELDIAQRCAEKLRNDDKASQALGINTDVTVVGEASARMIVRSDMVNGMDVCHGGLVFALADTAFAYACNAYNVQAFAASCHIEFLRPARLGDELLATASEDHRGRRSGYYTVKIHNQRGELVALFRGRSGGNGDPILSA